jgi:hypothetical protein
VYIGYGLYFYFSGLSLREPLKYCLIFCQTKAYVHLELDTKLQNQRGFAQKKKVKVFVIDETLLKIGSGLVWLWVAIEPVNRNSVNKHIRGKKHVCGRAFSIRPFGRTWGTLFRPTVELGSHKHADS